MLMGKGGRGILLLLLLVIPWSFSNAKMIHINVDEEKLLKQLVFQSEVVEVGKRLERLKMGIWRIHTTLVLQHESNPGGGQEHNHTFTTKEPARALSILLKRKITDKDLLLTSVVPPDFEIVFENNQSTTGKGGMRNIGGHFNIPRNERVQPAKALMDDFDKWNIRVTAPPPDAPRLMNVFGVRDQSSVAAGTMFYRSEKNLEHHKVEFNNCGGRVGSYSGAYLVSRVMFGQVDYSIKSHLEAASLSVFGSAHYSLKSSDFRDFHINHFSEWEHWNKRNGGGALKLDTNFSALMDQECIRVPYHDTASSSVDNRVHGLVLMPFWGGTAEESGGNSHSEASIQQKVLQASGTLCSGLRYFKRGVIGSCGAAHARMIAKWVIGKGFNEVNIYSPTIEFSYGNKLNDHVFVEENLEELSKLDQRLVLKDTFIASSKANDIINGIGIYRKDGGVVVNVTSKYRHISWSGDQVEPLSHIPLTDTDTLTILQFECLKGVHLPYHLLGTVQMLLRKGGSWGEWPNTMQESEAQDGVDVIYFTEADQVVKFRDLETSHAISKALYSPPVKTPENEKLWPKSHKDKIADEALKILQSMNEGQGSLFSLLEQQRLEEDRGKPIQFMIAPARMSMRFSERHLRYLKRQREFKENNMTLSEAFLTIVDGELEEYKKADRQAVDLARGSFTMTNACSVCPPIICPPTPKTPRPRPSARNKGSNNS